MNPNEIRPDQNPSYNQQPANQPNPQLPYFLQEDHSQQPDPKPGNARKIILITSLALLTISLIAISIFFSLQRGGNDQQLQTPGSATSGNSTPAEGNQDANQPGANQGQTNPDHDIQRRNILARYVNAGMRYITSEGGKLPLNALEVNLLLAAQDDDSLIGANPATNNNYEVVDTEPNPDQIQYVPKKACQGSELVDGNDNQFALRVQLSDGSLYCVNS